MLKGILMLILIFIFTRLIHYLCLPKQKHKKLKNAKTIIVIGSGGHTLEMMKLMRTLNPTLYSPRLYVVADGDQSSENKIKQLEEDSKNMGSYEVIKIPRSRSVNQSYFTSIFTTLYSILKCIPIVIKYKPDLVLCNGPGTCIPICLIAFMSNIFLFFSVKIVFIESICRVKTLSLSGKILLFIADVVIVQWAYLHKKYPQTVFLGKVV